MKETLLLFPRIRIVCDSRWASCSLIGVMDMISFPTRETGRSTEC